MPQAKTVPQTSVVMPVRMLPQDANPAGTVHGGVILRQIDLAGGIVATRHAQSQVVTSSLDRMDFLAPVYVGEVLLLKACVNFVGRTSMEVGVRVEAENMFTATVRHVASAYMTFVRLDENRKPAPLPPLAPHTDEERRRFEEARQRRQARKALRPGKSSPQTDKPSVFPQPHPQDIPE
ncbi:acyl-CoA thioesterase [Fundidesulfovibrio butyratiphilus]